MRVARVQRFAFQREFDRCITISTDELKFGKSIEKGI
jgi:hypothetical protein